MIENRKETGRKSDGLQPKRQDMAPRYLIGIDQSTQGTKAILLDLSLIHISRARH